MNLILSWALGIVYIYIKALHVHRKWDATEKQQKKKVIHTSIASEHPLPVFWLLGVFPSYPFCPTTAIIRCHLDHLSLNGIHMPAFSGIAGMEYTQADFLLDADCWILNSLLELPFP